MFLFYINMLLHLIHLSKCHSLIHLEYIHTHRKLCHPVCEVFDYYVLT